MRSDCPSISPPPHACPANNWRWACVDIRALPLQLLLRRHPEWAGAPAVVVDKDKPQGVILWANEAARMRRILPGMRYAAGLAITREVHGGVIPEAEIAAARDAVTQRLWCFSPRVEVSTTEAGVFWLDASGLAHLYPSLERWAELIRDVLREDALHAVVVVGFSRFGVYAAAKAASKNLYFATPAAERAYLRHVPMARLGIDPDFRDTLAKLSVDTVGQFLALPAGGLHERFGPEAAQLHRHALGTGWTPLEPEAIVEPLERSALFDWPEANLERVIARLARLLQALVFDLSERHETLHTLRIRLLLDDKGVLEEEISPATPTLDHAQILYLARLRLESLTLTAGVMELSARAVGVAVNEDQLELFHGGLANAVSRQQLEAARRAFAALRAEFGNDAVVCAALHEGHLPEAQYSWELCDALRFPQPSQGGAGGRPAKDLQAAARPVIRRLYAPAQELPPRERHEPDGWMIAGLADGPVEEVIGPQIVSGGWWARELSRAYYYVRTRSGRWLWIYHDQKRRRWFLQAEVQ